MAIQIEHHHYIHHLHDDGQARTLAQIVATLQSLINQGVHVMATLDQVLTGVSANTTRIGSLRALMTGIRQQLAEALAGVTLPPAAQAKVDAIFAGVETNASEIDAALNENAPPAATPPTA